MGQPHVCQNMKIIGIDADGCFAEFVNIPIRNIWKIDPAIPEHYAAILDPLGNAVHTVLAGEISAENVVVTGAGSDRSDVHQRGACLRRRENFRHRSEPAPPRTRPEDGRRRCHRSQQRQRHPASARRDRRRRRRRPARNERPSRRHPSRLPDASQRWPRLSARHPERSRRPSTSSTTSSSKAPLCRAFTAAKCSRPGFR